MENQNNNTDMMDMIRQIHQTTTVLAQNQALLFDKFKILDAKSDQLSKKIDDNYAKLDKKIDDNYAKLDKKIDDNYAKLDKKIDDSISMIKDNSARITSLEKQVQFLRDDIDTVYALETDSRSKLKKLL